jgi:hypothetical protein
VNDSSINAAQLELRTHQPCDNTSELRLLKHTRRLTFRLPHGVARRSYHSSGGTIDEDQLSSSISRQHGTSCPGEASKSRLTRLTYDVYMHDDCM